MLAVSRKMNKQFNNCGFRSYHRSIIYRSKGISPITISFYIVGIVSLAAMLIMYLSQCAQIVSCQYKICRLKETKSTLERSRLGLKLEVNRLSSLDRIEAIARNELRMTSPPVRLVLDLRQPMVQASLEDVVAVEKIPRN